MAASASKIRFQAFALAVCAAGMAILLFFVLRSAGGQLMYSLDDPYIHLSLAENLIRGHYGVNLDEVASPSSSIVYPFLLAAGLLLGFGDFAPMVLNVIGALGSAWLLAGFLWDALPKNDDQQVAPLAFAAVPIMLLSVNGYALAFAGMEHTLHVWASLGVVAGLARLSRDTSPSLLFLVAIIAAPLLRFEGVALSGAALLALVVWSHWTRAILTGGVIVAIFASYIGLMSSLGLPLLPSSVMVKSGAAAAAATFHFGALVGEVFASLRDSLSDRQGVTLAVAIVLLAVGAIRSKASPQARTLACVAIAASLAHLLVGRWNWFGRYEVYIVASAIAALLFVWAPWLSAQSRRTATPVLVIVLSPLIGLTYLLVTYLTPPAARNLFEQQYQMHRFATAYFPKPVAVNDLGWVTYRNDAYVLDLWGLGSEKARRLFRTDGRTAQSVATLTQDANLSYAMIYEELFTEGLPNTWCRIAQLTTSQVTSTHDTVEFFLIESADEADMRAALAAFKPTIPVETSLETFACAEPSSD